MKLITLLLGLTRTSDIDAFGNLAIRPSFSRNKVILEGSRAKQKAESRTAWMEKRGYGKSDETEVQVLKNEDGLEYVKLVNDNNDSSDVYLYGGVVTSYKKDGQEFIAVRPDAKTDGSKPISGGLSHCWPQFGPGEIQQHGFARNCMWTIKSQSPSNVELELKP